MSEKHQANERGVPLAALPVSMRAVRLYGPHLEPVIEHLPLPRLLPGEAMLRVLACGVCHTDLQLLNGSLNPGVWPITPGHEVTGQIVAVYGSTAHPRVGARSIVFYSTPCRECEWCRAGQEQVCPNAGPQRGLSADGGFAEFMAAPLECLVDLPSTMDAAAAAPLACAAATALHAARAVADVRAGETVVVYGIGGVGLPLVQLARQQGARVLAVGRSQEKLALAAGFGAEAIDANQEDPVLAVRRRSNGDGAHVVFELVGSEESIPAAVDMLRRQGRLVFIGYGSGLLRLNPLRLVLRETRILSSVGNTLSELEEVLQRAAEGSLEVPLAGAYPLESAAEALAALRDGQLAGRAVLLPAMAGPDLFNGQTHFAFFSSRDRPSHSQAGSPPDFPPASRNAQPAESPAESRVLHNTKCVPTTGVVRGRLAQLAAAPPVSVAGASNGLGIETSELHASPPLEDEVRQLVSKGIGATPDDAEFSELALRLFAYQYASNGVYQALCDRRQMTPARAKHWRDIPPVPIAAFKETLLCCEPRAGGTEFNSSGTSQPEKKSRHIHPSLRLYNLNASINFKAHVLPDAERMRIFTLFPRREEAPHSSLAHWLSLMVEQFGEPGSEWFVANEGGLDAAALDRSLRQAEDEGTPVCLLAASFGLVHFLEACEAAGSSFQLPPGSRVMDTGGYKGRSREYSKQDLYLMTTQTLGIPESHIVNMYGMTEHGTQFLDVTLREALRTEDPASPCLSARGQRPHSQRRKTVPPWARTLVVDPETMLEQPPGKQGLLLHVDLINRASVIAVLSEDIGYAVGDGFELLGRAQGSEARGCSIALDELLQAAGSRR